MLKGKTKTGFEFEIDSRVLDNYELLELLSEVEENPLVVTKVLSLLLGEKKQELIDHVREEDGFVSSEKMMEEFEEIFKASDQVKNS